MEGLSWTPISRDELITLIRIEESFLNESLSKFWNKIKIQPRKWFELSNGKEGNGFWVVAIVGNKILWYNDIRKALIFQIIEHMEQLVNTIVNKTV